MLTRCKNAHLSSNSYNSWTQPNIVIKFAGYVALIVLYKRCKFGEKICNNSRDSEFFLGYYYFLARPVCPLVFIVQVCTCLWSPGFWWRSFQIFCSYHLNSATTCQFSDRMIVIERTNSSSIIPRHISARSLFSSSLLFMLDTTNFTNKIASTDDKKYNKSWKHKLSSENHILCVFWRHCAQWNRQWPKNEKKISRSAFFQLASTVMALTHTQTQETLRETLS